MLPPSRLSCSHLLSWRPSSPIVPIFLHRTASNRVRSIPSRPRSARLLLPLSLLSICFPVRPAPSRHLSFMAWSAQQHASPQPLPNRRSRALLLAVASVVVACVAVAAALWNPKYAASTTPLAASCLAPLTAVFPVSSADVACRECSSDSNAGLIDNMVRRGVLQSPVVAAAMKRVDRRHYITPASPASRSLHPSSAYVDSPQYLGTCSRSHPITAFASRAITPFTCAHSARCCAAW